MNTNNENGFETLNTTSFCAFVRTVFCLSGLCMFTNEPVLSESGQLSKLGADKNEESEIRVVLEFRE